MNGLSFRVAGDVAPLACMLVAAAALGVSAWQVDDALRSANSVQGLQDRVVASVVAEEAAFASVDWMQSRASAAERQFEFLSPTGMRAVVRPHSRGPARVTVTGRTGRVYRFDYPMLAGALPAPLGHALSLRHAVISERPELRTWLNGNLDIELNPVGQGAVSAAPARWSSAVLCGDLARMPEPGAACAGCLEEDSAVALLRTKQGTDRRDYRFVEAMPMALENEVVVVPGNLWVDHAAEPLVFDLRQGSRTIVVHGNVYLGRDVTVRGPGRLVIVAVRHGAEGFRDVDLDGGYESGEPVHDGGSRYRGPVEGSGSVYLGIPGRTVAVGIQASLLADGEVYVVADRATVEGALVVGEGITWRGGTPRQGSLRLPGTRLSNTARARIPGLRREGGLRPGFLVPLD